MIAGPAPDGGQPERAQQIAERIDSVVLRFATHWLAVFAGYGSVILGLAVLAPMLAANGHETASRLIYLPFRLICHQREDRSFHLHGEPLAFCHRDVAIVGGAVTVALLFAVGRRWRPVPPVRFAVAVLFAVPMAIDGGTQLIGLRESTAELRVITGSLFSIGAGLFVLPHLEAGFATIRDDIHRRTVAGHHESTVSA